MRKQFLVLIAVLLLLLGIGTEGLAAITYTVEPGVNPNAVNLGAVRFKSFGNTPSDELYLGVPVLDNPTNRVGVDFKDPTGDGSNPYYLWGSKNDVTFRYDFGGDTLNSTVDIGGLGIVNIPAVYPEFSTKASNPNWLDQIDYFQIVLFAGEPDVQVEFKSVILNGVGVGNFEAQDGEELAWNVTGFNFTDGFQLSARLNLKGAFDPAAINSDLSKVELQFGHIVPIPGAVWLLASGLIGLLVVGKRRTQ